MKRFLYKGFLGASLVLAILSAAWLIAGYCLLKGAGSAYRGGDYPKALTKYLAASLFPQDNGLSSFGAGAALYKKGEYAKAAAYFTAAAAAQDPDLRQKSSYNLGNCLFQLGHQQTDGRASRRLYREALHYYDRAFAADRNDEDARHNKAITEGMLEKMAMELASKSPPPPPGANDDRQYQRDRRPPSSQDPLTGQGKSAIDAGPMKDAAGDDRDKKDGDNREAARRMTDKIGAMTKEGAELLLEEFRKRETAGWPPPERASRGHAPPIEKDW